MTQKIPKYCSAAYFALRQQERAAAREAQRYRDRVDREPTIEKKLECVGMARKAQQQADAYANLLLASVLDGVSRNFADDGQAERYLRVLRNKEMRLLRLIDVQENEERLLALAARAMRDPAEVEHVIMEKVIVCEDDIRRVHARLKMYGKEWQAR